MHNARKYSCTCTMFQYINSVSKKKKICVHISKRISFTLQKLVKTKLIQNRAMHLSSNNFLSLFRLPFTFQSLLTDCNPFVFHFSLIFNPSKDWLRLSHGLATLKSTPLGISLQCKTT